MKVSFGFRKFVIVIVNLILAFLILYTIYLFIFDNSEEENFTVAIIFYFILLFLVIKNIICNLVPKYFQEMKAVFKYISLSELNNLLEEEVFSPIDLPLKVSKKFSNKKLRSIRKEILVSDNFLIVNRIIIPKKMILCIDTRPFIYRSVSPNVDIMSFRLVDNRYFEIDTVSDQFKGLKNYLNKEYVNDGSLFNEVKTKEQFLEYISGGKKC